MRGYGGLKTLQSLIQMSVTTRFITAFDAQNQSHVKWLSRMIDVAEKMGDPSKDSNLINEINKNPMGVKLEQMEALEWPHIHFCICAVYAKAVLRKRAFVPV
jgi:hypothetical protein